MTQLRPLNEDHGYTVERCKEAIGACSALATTGGQRDYWEKVLNWWEAQLRFAEKRA